MNFKKLLTTKVSTALFIVVCIALLTYKHVSHTNHALEKSSTQEQIDSTDNQIQSLLLQLNQEFAHHEATNPQQGYCVTIHTNPTLQAKITSYGGPRTTQLLSGIPTDQAVYITTCPFCAYTKTDAQKSTILKDFHDGTYAVKSLNNQILVIPYEHYNYLFTTPLKLQTTILKNILLIRDQYPHNIKRPIEFHCGSAAGQTVFHLHGRTGVYIN